MDQKAVRKYSCSLDGIKQVINDFYTKLGRGGDAAVVLTPYQAYDAKTALDLLSAAKMSISLADCVRSFLEASKVGKNTSVITIGEAFDKYTESFGENQKLQIRTVKTRVGSFVTAYGKDKKLTDIDPKWLAEYLKRDHGNSNKTYNNYLSYIKTFVRWCTKPEQGWIKESPIAGMSVKAEEFKEPEYMQAEDVRKLFALLEKNDRSILAYAICSFFMGLRREEILRAAIDPTAVTFSIEKKLVVVHKPKGHTKGILPRSFTMTDNALEWLKAFDFFGALARVKDKTTEKMKKIAEDAKLDMPKNPGRHTFISMHVAAYGEPHKTEAMVGTSRKMRINNYCGISISKEDAIGYFQINPNLDSFK